MGFFSKIASALKKTKDKFSDTFARVFSIDRIGEEFYDELLDALISSDISVNTAMEIVDDLRDKMIEGSVKDKEEVIDSLKETLIEKLSVAEPIVNVKVVKPFIELKAALVRKLVKLLEGDKVYLLALLVRYINIRLLVKLYTEITLVVVRREHPYKRKCR